MSSDQSGSITDMAVDGTKVPEDAAKPRIIPSVPRADQITSDSEMGATNLAEAADNAQDISRTTKDKAPTTDVMTGTGDSLPAEIGSKRLHNVVNADLAKGHPRFDKHSAKNESDQTREASDGAQQDEVIDGVVGGRP